jgi:polyhydroxyalkanoate synthesis regulator phasin
LLLPAGLLHHISAPLLHPHVILFFVVEALRRAEECIRRVLAEADPKLVPTSKAVEFVEAFIALERLATAGKLLYAHRASESKSWAKDGHRSAAAWLAEKEKCTFGEASTVLDTSRRLGDLDMTSDVLRKGELSPAQAKEIAQAAEKDARSEQGLLKAASEETMKELKGRVRQVMVRSSSEAEEAERYNKVRSTRFVRWWSDYDGAFRLEAKLTPDDGARVASSIEAEADAIFIARRVDGERESPAVYRADALLSLACGTALTHCGSQRQVDSTSDVRGSGTAATRRGSGSGGRRDARTDTISIRVDARALRRGHAAGDEICEIPGIGAVPVSVVRRLLPESFVKILVKDGVDVKNVCHVGRTISAHVRSAVEERDPRCVVPGCDVAFGLEIHHWVEDFASSGTTNLDGICRVCKRHHAMITYEGFKLIGGPGAWDIVRPDPVDTS